MFDIVKVEDTRRKIMKKVEEKINSLEIYKVEEGYEIHLNSLSVNDIITCSNEEELLKEIEKLLPDLKNF